MDSARNIETWGKVEGIAQGILEERGPDWETTVAEAITVASAYLLAMERTRKHHHPEDQPSSVVWPEERAPETDEELAAQQSAWIAVWNVIGDANTKTNDARYGAAWDVWGVIIPQDEHIEGMGQE